MCGILGFAGHVPEGKWEETHDLLTALFLVSEERGKDATGFVAKTEAFKHPLAGSIVMDKSPVPASRFVKESSRWRGLRHRRCSSVLGHVRWATSGSPDDNRHNHPLVGHSGLYLVHNGVLADHKGTAQKHGLELTTEVDSELILRFVEAAEHPALGLQTALRRVEGSMAVVVYDGKRNLLYLGRDYDRPLWLLRLSRDSRWWFASTKEILLDAFTMILGDDVASRIEMLTPLAAGTVHVLYPSGKLLALSPGRQASE